LCSATQRTSASPALCSRGLEGSLRARIELEDGCELRVAQVHLCALGHAAHLDARPPTSKVRVRRSRWVTKNVNNCDRVEAPDAQQSTLGEPRVLEPVEVVYVVTVTSRAFRGSEGAQTRACTCPTPPTETTRSLRSSAFLGGRKLGGGGVWTLRLRGTGTVGQGRGKRRRARSPQRRSRPLVSSGEG